MPDLQRLPVEVGGWLSGVGASDGGAGLASGGYDSALAILDGLAQPILDPFVEGLKVWLCLMASAVLYSRRLGGDALLLPSSCLLHSCNSCKQMVGHIVALKMQRTT